MYYIFFIFLFLVNLADNGGQRVDMSHFDLLKVLGTGGQYIWKANDSSSYT